MAMDASTTRRGALIAFAGAGLAASGLAGCVQAGAGPDIVPGGPSPAAGGASPLPGDDLGEFGDLAAHYAARPDEQIPVPALDIAAIPPRFLRQEIAYRGSELPGTVVVDPDNRHLYLVTASGIATRYGVGVGREGFGWTGFARVGRKAKWPRWTPPADMIRRRPDLEPFRNGMPPGLENPLGARALYLFDDRGRDTLYRLHGTNEPQSIGQAVSSGCIRMFNQDAIDLYDRVPVDANVVVLPHGAA
jgi:lipoprotein-anchoring transpeptidase ErfK/SrfK